MKILMMVFVFVLSACSDSAVSPARTIRLEAVADSDGVALAKIPEGLFAPSLEAAPLMSCYWLNEEKQALALISDGFHAFYTPYCMAQIIEGKWYVYALNVVPEQTIVWVIFLGS